MSLVLLLVVHVSSASIHTPIQHVGRCATLGVCIPDHQCRPDFPELPPHHQAQRHHQWADCANNAHAITPTFAMPLCPEFSRSACCDHFQYKALEASIEDIRPIIAPCPACLDNLAAFMCAVACSPDQSIFVQVNSTFQTPGMDPMGRPFKPVVNETTVIISRNVAQRIYESCKDVDMSAGGHSTISLMRFFGDALNARDLFDFLGSRTPSCPNHLGGSLHKQHIVFSPNHEDMERFVAGTIHCNSTVEGMRCPCAHCPDACPDPLPGSSSSSTGTDNAERPVIPLAPPPEWGGFQVSTMIMGTMTILMMAFLVRRELGRTMALSARDPRAAYYQLREGFDRDR